MNMINYKTKKIGALALIAMMYFVNDSFAADANEKTAEKPAAKAASPISDKFKSNGPIEINSDSLEVLQQSHQAIFTGHVVAIQGDVHIKSEKMTVHYKNSDAEKSKEKSMVAGVAEKNSIEKIVVEKNVFLTTPEETAKGESGLYDVVNNKIFLNDNVVLTRDNNVLKGDRLVYDFQTGKSQLNSSASEDPSKPKQRVKALFIPDSDKKKQTK